MSTPIAAVSGLAAPTQAVHAADGAQSAHKAEKLKQAAQEFESLLIKQLLTAAKMGGEAKGGYADMGIDALATGVEKAGGLGLARRLEQALSPAVAHAHTPSGHSGG